MTRLLQFQFSQGQSHFGELDFFSFFISALLRIRSIYSPLSFFWVDYWDDGLVELCPSLFVKL